MAPPSAQKARRAPTALLAAATATLIASDVAVVEAKLPMRYASMDRRDLFHRLWSREGQRHPPPVSSVEYPAPRFVPQKQDHFDGSNNNTWMQAYYVNDTFFQAHSSSPIFLCVGGEGPPLDGSAVVDSVHCNVAVEWLQETGALMFALEHRYYGCHNDKACPVANLSEPGALKFHSSRQALADLASFVAFANEKYGLTSENKWVTFGGSYPGMLAGWARLKYPHLIFASVSSSAPVHAELNMVGYNDVIAEAYSTSVQGVGGSEECRQAITDGHATIGSLFKTEEGRSQLATLFGGDADDYAKHDFQVNFAGQGVFVFPGQGNDPACTEDFCNIAKVCKFMTDPTSTKTPVEKLAYLKKSTVESLTRELSSAEVKSTVSETPTPGYGSGDQLWAWQTCTEFGFYQTCEVGSKCMWTQGLATLDEEMSFCQSDFNIPKELVAANIAQSNVDYGSLHPDGSRVLYVNGGIDPWKANSILSCVGPELPAFMVPGSSHHFWTHPSLPTDQESVVAVRSKIRRVVQHWLDQHAEQIIHT
mmetsp:Transcript_66044/g.137950  ORF Transcript_66044/g.137950 Transcript_66044/m.137950 type:complete len:535 (+) Transcript_66044:76-1680(+)|eukprot:CAMPEP_0206602894 /NCGR_PEP_ID=MMETSP0325_2-20121206/47813_1 /ASSEMBLY_ACC=CAM_ASM_000347 /TAXON_ID=2866 /ORGANISM="Crypthecodinium cohnii, Strain Seligo" /LENGTH=534 /DNA_ID=CAMNT_0054115777 /DNA_START=40 /DNA_END=1644 /DNA_ORIENTATION=+